MIKSWMIVVVAIIVMSITGCSSTKQIAKSATRVNTSAIEIQQAASQLHDSLVQTNGLLVDVPQSTPQAVETIGLVSASISDCIADTKTIIDQASGIQHDVGDIHAAVTQTKDVQNQWVTLGIYIAGAVICVAVVFTLWRSGVFAIMFSLVGFFKPSRAAGTLAAKSIAAGTANAESMAQVAISRTNDPVFNRAYEKQTKKQNEKANTNE